MKWCFGFLLFIVLLCGSCKDDNEGQIRDTTINYELGISFPPVSNNMQRAFAAPLLAELNVQIIRFSEEWKNREPEEGAFNWTPLDERLDWADNNALEVLLTIQSNGPDWACSAQQNEKSCVYTDNEKFKNYIEELLQRYPNRIAKIQFGNEWQSDFWYIGNEQEFVTANNIVYDAVQKYSPNTTFVLGGFTAISLRFLAGCAGVIDTFYNDEGILFDRVFLDENCDDIEIVSVKNRINFILQNTRYDEVDIHLYDDAENWAIYYDNIIGLTQKPIIITEFGGPNLLLEPDDEGYQSERLEVYIKAINDLDVEQAYFFKLVEGSSNPVHAKSGLISNPELMKKQSYFIFQEFNN